jgi:hypothetical protein
VVLDGSSVLEVLDLEEVDMLDWLPVVVAALLVAVEVAVSDSVPVVVSLSVSVVDSEEEDAEEAEEVLAGRELLADEVAVTLD